MLAGQLDLAGVTLNQFQQCSYAVGVVQDTSWSSVDSSDPTDTSPVAAVLRILYSSDLTLEVTQGAPSSVSIFTGIQISGAAMRGEFASFDGAGNSSSSPGFSSFDLTDLSLGAQIHWTIGGSADLPVMLPRNQGFDLDLTNFAEIAAFHTGAAPSTYSINAEFGSGSTLSWSIVSLDPDVVFTSAVPEPPLAALLAPALAAAGAARLRVSARRR
jgi:hypothetical protein